MLSLHHFLHDRLDDLGISTMIAPEGLNKTFAGIDIKVCRRLSSHKISRPDGSIRVLTPEALARLSGMDDHFQEAYFHAADANHVLFLIFSQTTVLPPHLKSLCEKRGLSAACSEFNEHILSSRLKSLTQERIRFCIRFHGVAVESGGKGILITGPSDTGKTSSALKYVQNGHYWIADDLITVRKNRHHHLMVSGHPKIRHYVYTARTGIIPIEECIEKTRIKKRTVLWGVVELFHADERPHAAETRMKKILDTSVRCVRMPIRRTGHFNENLLEAAIEHLSGAA